MITSRILNTNWRGSVFNEQAEQLRPSEIGRTGITYPWFSYSSLRETKYHFMRNHLVVLKSPAIHNLVHKAAVMYVTGCFKFPINDTPPPILKYICRMCDSQTCHSICSLMHQTSSLPVVVTQWLLPSYMKASSNH